MARQLLSLVLILSVLLVSSSAKDWCSIFCRTNTREFYKHVMCTYKQDEPSPQCNEVKKRYLDQSEINIILQHHNNLRRSAANLPPLVWDEELATVAQTWADQCNFGHDKCRNLIENHSVGQNVAMNWGTPDKTRIQIQKLLSQWSDEKRNVNRNIIASYPHNDSIHMAVGHYTQIVWRKTTKIGCGFISYTKDPVHGFRSASEVDIVNYLVCNYDVGGNLPGAPVY